MPGSHGCHEGTSWFRHVLLGIENGLFRGDRSRRKFVARNSSLLACSSPRSASMAASSTRHDSGSMALARRGGTTTFIKVGSAGSSIFAGFRKYVAEPSLVRILAFLNVSFPGIRSNRPPILVGECVDVCFLNANECLKVAREHADQKLGIKVRTVSTLSTASGLWTWPRTWNCRSRPTSGRRRRPLPRWWTGCGPTIFSPTAAGRFPIPRSCAMARQSMPTVRRGRGASSDPTDA